MDPVIDPEAVRASVERHARVTPLLPASALSDCLGREVLLKAECLQPTGSFKVRGAAARLEALSDEERARGIVACSSGNHGRAISFVAGRMGIPAKVYVPEWVDPVKLAGIQAGGAEAVTTGATYDEAEARAIENAHAEHRTFVSAYDDPWVIAGQGTIALELMEQVEEAHARLGAVIVPLSGGGLAGGIALALQNALGDPAPRVVAVSAENAAVMLASVRAGEPVELPEEETLANALAGGIGLKNRFSFPLIRDRIDTHVTVTEAQIADAMRYSLERLHVVVEGGGAVGLAALLAGVWPPTTESTGVGATGAEEGSIVVVLSGGNVATETLLDVLTD